LGKYRKTMQQVVQTDKTMTQLPQELWTHILSYVPYAELWYAYRLASRAFHKDSNFILRNQYISKEISIISSKTYMSFSHFDAANMACFRPSDIQERFQDLIKRRLKVRAYLGWLYDKEPLIIMQLPHPDEPAPESCSQIGRTLPRRFLWTDKSRAGVQVGSKGVSLDWREVCAKYMVHWNNRDLTLWTKNM
jgi:hypothetical protein